MKRKGLVWLKLTFLSFCIQLFSINAESLDNVSGSTENIDNTIRENLIKATDKKAYGEYVRKRFLSLMKKPFNNSDGRKKALVIGDSYAQDFYNSVIEGHYLKDYQIRTRYIPVRCQIFLGKPSQRKIKKGDHSFCDKADSLSKAKQQISESDLVVLVGSWKEWSAKSLPKTIHNLALKSDQKLIVLGKKSYGRMAIHRFLKMPLNDLRSLRNTVDAGQTEINKILRKGLSENVFIDQHEMICGKQETCPLFTDKMELISFDGGHLTEEGARYTGRILFQNPILKNL